jgi:Rps23 Pro-64 3,4-dihydroxylase Tpa1-like proline 4-hydroxylase
VVRDFLGEDYVRRLLEFAQAHEHEFRRSKVVDGDSSTINDLRRVSLILPKIGDHATIIADRTRKALPEIFAALGCAPFEPAQFETEMAAHGDGAFFSRHIDMIVNPVKSDTQRVLSMVYYFHKIPQPFSGGILRLYSLADGPGAHIDVEPACDSAVFFQSWFPHEVLRITCPSGRFADSRFAINCWLRKKI